jgi:hypothetical protein
MFTSMEKELVANLSAVFAAFAKASNLSTSTIWLRAAKDARFMTRVEGGGSFTVKTYDAVISWFSANWPENAVWPESVVRPFQTEAAE